MIGWVDTSNDQQIDLNEFATYLTREGDKALEANTKLFKVYDIDGNQLVSKPELKLVAKSQDK